MRGVADAVLQRRGGHGALSRDQSITRPGLVGLGQQPSKQPLLSYTLCRSAAQARPLPCGKCGTLHKRDNRQRRFYSTFIGRDAPLELRPIQDACSCTPISRSLSLRDDTLPLTRYTPRRGGRYAPAVHSPTFLPHAPPHLGSPACLCLHCMPPAMARARSSRLGCWCSGRL